MSNNNSHPLNSCRRGIGSVKHTPAVVYPFNYTRAEYLNARRFSDYLWETAAENSEATTNDVHKALCERPFCVWENETVDAILTEMQLVDCFCSETDGAPYDFTGSDFSSRWRGAVIMSLKQTNRCFCSLIA